MSVREGVRGGRPPRSFYGLSGLDQVRALVKGDIPRPPISHLTGWRVTQAGSGTATVTVPVSPWLRVPDGTIDIPVIVETALSIAAMTGASPGTVMRTAAVTINHFRPVALGSAERLIARARVVNSGRTFTFAEAAIEDDSGRAVAHGTGSVVAHPTGDVSGAFQPVEPSRYSTPDPWELPGPDDEMPYEMWAQNDGLSWIRKMAADEAGVVPIYRLMGMRLTDAGEGFCLAELQPSEWITDLDGWVANSAIASFASIHLAGATLSLSPGGRWMGVVDQSLSILRRVTADAGPLLMRATVVSRSEQFFITTAEITDDEGNHVTVAQQTAVLRERPQTEARPESKRTLTTILFSDLVDSTPTSERVGDERWKEVVEEHNAVVRREVRAFRGREVKTTGDGFLVVFDSPARAVQCARAIRDGVRRLGLDIRVGLHTGECDIVGDDISGIAVAIAKRIETAAGSNEILVSSTVRDLVVGSGIQFADHGTHHLKGVEGDWRLYSVAR